MECSRVADTDRHGGKQRSDAPGFEENNEAGRVRLLSQHRCRARNSRADSDRLAVLEGMRGAYDHQLDWRIRGSLLLVVHRSPIYSSRKRCQEPFFATLARVGSRIKIAKNGS